MYVPIDMCVLYIYIYIYIYTHIYLKLKRLKKVPVTSAGIAKCPIVTTDDEIIS
jgi:hypothetical protein